jgi:hypothetical protein
LYTVGGTPLCYARVICRQGPEGGCGRRLRGRTRAARRAEGREITMPAAVAQ